MIPLSAVSNPPLESDFSLANLPYGVVQSSSEIFPATRVGNVVLNLVSLLEQLGPVSEDREIVLAALRGQRSLNAFMALPKKTRVAARALIKSCIASLTQAVLNVVAHSLESVKCLLPCSIGDYSDFYCSKDHAFNVGTMFRGPADALQPNWLHLPVGYHGRSSSIVTSGTPIHHPHGQIDNGKSYGPSKRLDFELEVGVFLGGPGNPMGHPVSVAEARDLIFGYVLLNDWSARDVQTWEYVPLGPFNSKNFATTISCWIIPVEALDDYLVEPSSGPQQNPQPLPYLYDAVYKLPNMTLTASLIHPQGQVLVCTTNFRNLYWTPAQMIAHHSSTGCNLRPGDLIGTGTLSGPTEDSRACLLELTWNGTKPINLGNMQTRTFLQPGDGIRLEGFLITKSGSRVGFGECAGMIIPRSSVL